MGIQRFMANMRPLCQAMQVDKFIFVFKKQLSSATKCPPLELEGELGVTFYSGWRFTCKIQLICSIALVLFWIRASPPILPI
jgi:hypothetical protein